MRAFTIEWSVIISFDRAPSWERERAHGQRWKRAPTSGSEFLREIQPTAGRTKRKRINKAFRDFFSPREPAERRKRRALKRQFNPRQADSRAFSLSFYAHFVVYFIMQRRNKRALWVTSLRLKCAPAEAEPAIITTKGDKNVWVNTLTATLIPNNCLFDAQLKLESTKILQINTIRTQKKNLVQLIHFRWNKNKSDNSAWSHQNSVQLEI